MIIACNVVSKVFQILMVIKLKLFIDSFDLQVDGRSTTFISMAVLELFQMSVVQWQTSFSARMPCIVT